MSNEGSLRVDQDIVREFVRGLYSKSGIFGGEDRCHDNVGRMLAAIKENHPNIVNDYRLALFWKAKSLSSDGLPFMRVREGQEPKPYFWHAIMLDDKDRVYDLYAPEDVFGATIEQYIKGVFDKNLKRFSTPEEFKLAIASAEDIPSIGDDGILRLDISKCPSVKYVTFRQFMNGDTGRG